MKKFFAIVLSIVSVAGQSNAYIVSDRDNDSSIYVDEDRLSPQQRMCSEYLYQHLSSASSKTDVACSRGRTDFQFRDCTINLTKYLNDTSFDEQGYPHPKNVIYAAEACLYSSSYESAKCASDLFLRGGLYVSNPNQPVDAVRVCSNSQSFQIKNCILERTLNRGMSGVQAAKICIEQYDPVIKARREAELRRIEEEKRRRAEADRRAAEQRAAEQRAAAQRAAEQRAAEQRRIEEQRRQGDQRTQEQKRQEELRRQQEEQRRKDEEARKKKEEEEKKKQQEQQQHPSNPPAPSNGGTGSGVIVDLPNFE